MIYQWIFSSPPKPTSPFIISFRPSKQNSNLKTFHKPPLVEHNHVLGKLALQNQFVKIVYPGGHAELHDRPVLAADIVLHNSKCCVTHPTVFQNPWAIVEPETLLMPGQKFYVVPLSTVRKLQRFSIRYSPSCHGDHYVEMSSPCLSSGKGRDQDSNVDRDQREGLLSDIVKLCCFGLPKLKGNKDVHLRDPEELTMKSSKINLTSMRGSPKLVSSLDHHSWHPNLESITEE